MMNKSKYKHFKSINHKTLVQSIIRKYIIFKPIFDEIDEIMRRYITINNKKQEKSEVRCILKLFTTTNHVRRNRINTKLNLDYSFRFSEKLILSRINQG